MSYGLCTMLKHPVHSSAFYTGLPVVLSTCLSVKLLEATKTVADPGFLRGRNANPPGGH